jgi:hypothetical protein
MPACEDSRANNEEERKITVIPNGKSKPKAVEQSTACTSRSVVISCLSGEEVPVERSISCYRVRQQPRISMGRNGQKKMKEKKMKMKMKNSYAVERHHAMLGIHRPIDTRVGAIHDDCIGR